MPSWMTKPSSVRSDSLMPAELTSVQLRPIAALSSMMAVLMVLPSPERRGLRFRGRLSSAYAQCGACQLQLISSPLFDCREQRAAVLLFRHMHGHVCMQQLEDRCVCSPMPSTASSFCLDRSRLASLVYVSLPISSEFSTWQPSPT